MIDRSQLWLALNPPMNEGNESIGQFVRERRKANHLSQQKLAELASVSARFISQLEQGKDTVRLDVVNRVLAVFGKTLGLVDLPRRTK